MTLVEAIAVYLTLKNQNRSDQENRALAAAWGMIFNEADRVIRAGDYTPTRS